MASDGVAAGGYGASFSHGKLESMSFTRITVRGDQMGGVPCIRGLRIPVATVVGMLADGMNDPEILAAYPDLEAEDIREAMRYAAEAVRRDHTTYEARPCTASATAVRVTIASKAAIDGWATHHGRVPG
jgi:uncharacterized protein (DUF433 family)